MTEASREEEGWRWSTTKVVYVSESITASTIAEKEA